MLNFNDNETAYTNYGSGLKPCLTKIKLDGQNEPELSELMICKRSHRLNKSTNKKNIKNAVKITDQISKPFALISHHIGDKQFTDGTTHHKDHDTKPLP